MVIFLYTQPYISTAANVAEAILSISTTCMLLQSVHPTFELPTLLRDVNSTCLDENSIVTFNTWTLATLYYFPLAVTAFFFTRSLVKFTRYIKQAHITDTLKTVLYTKRPIEEEKERTVGVSPALSKTNKCCA